MSDAEVPILIEDRVAKWRREGLEADARRAEAKRALRREEHLARVAAHDDVDQRIGAAIETERAAARTWWHDVLAELIAAERRLHRDHLDDLERKLRTEIATLKGELVGRLDSKRRARAR